jgi:hypothetical protein
MATGNSLQSISHSNVGNSSSPSDDETNFNITPEEAK